MSKPLSEIIAAITQEIASAALQADVHRARWQAIYDEHELLREFTPSRVQLREMKVSLPLALDSISDGGQVKPALTHNQLIQLLPARLADQDRRSYAARLSHLLSKQQLHLLSEDLEGQLEKMILTVVPDSKPEHIDLTPLQRFRQEYLSHPDNHRQADFIYRASELEKLDPQHILRIDLSIDID